MRKLIVVLSIAVFGFAGWTFWNDPTVGPIVQSWVPEDVNVASIKTSLSGITGGFSTGGSSTSGGTGGGGPTGRYGGIGAAGKIAGAITGGN